MDRLILNEKLESLRRCVQRIEERRAESVEALRHDPDRQDILSLNLTRAVQLCVDIAVHILADTNAPAPQTMADDGGGIRRARRQGSHHLGPSGAAAPRRWIPQRRHPPIRGHRPGDRPRNRPWRRGGFPPVCRVGRLSARFVIEASESGRPVFDPDTPHAIANRRPDRVSTCGNSVPINNRQSEGWPVPLRADSCRFQPPESV